MTKTLYCSFCGTSQHEARKLIAGPTVFICDGCVEICNDILKERVAIPQAELKPNEWKQGFKEGYKDGYRDGQHKIDKDLVVIKEDIKEDTNE